MIALSDLRAAATQRRDFFQAKANQLDDRRHRELAAALASQGSVSSALAKERHAVRLRLDATTALLAAIDDVAAEMSNKGSHG